mmetsp:Transcript_41663/g.120701  ORF Transcript_41663/g.120701 Transcript_41663/m.120701 type:complete len:953 (-) Transcript_41663:43-2901(-)
MVLRVASIGLLRLLLTLRPAAALAAAAAWQGPSDALALVQRALLQQAVLQEPPAQQPPKESSQQLEQSFPPGSEAEVAVAAGSGGVEFQRCTIVGHGAAPNSHDIYLLDVAPAYRSVTSVPWELLRSPGGAGRPASELQVLLGGGAPDDRREVVDKAVALLKRSAKAPADPAKAAELEAALRHEAAKTEALKARLELEQAEAGKRKRWSRTPAAKAAKPRRGKASASFDAFDRNGDGIVTREEFQASEPAKQAANSTQSMPSPSPMPARLRAKVDAGQSVKVWERRAKDWEGECQEEERPRLLQVLEAVRREKAEAVLARLPATCSGQQLGGGGQAVAYEELTTCVQALTNTSWACSVCPVKFMISLGANCQRRCTSLVQGRGRGSDCLECVRQPALRLLRCAGAPGVGEIERRLFGIRLSERTAELFRGGLAESMGGQQALNRLQRQAWAVQRLIVAWGLDPKGLDMLAAPLLKAIGVKTEAELDDTPVPPALPSDESASALITASDVALYDADGSGSLDGEELSRAIAGVVERKSGHAESKKGSQELPRTIAGVAEGKHDAEGKKGREESAAEGVSNTSNTTAVPVVLSREERRRINEEGRLKLLEERKRQAEAHEKWKEERRKAQEEARQKAAEDAKRRVEEMAKKKADQLAERQAREEAARQAKEEEKRKAEEDARLEREEEEERRRNFEARQKADEDARIKAIEDARRQTEEEERRAAEAERQRIENDPRLKAQEAAWKDALALEEEGQGETLANEAAKRKAEEEAKSSAAEEAARQKAAEEARRTEEAAKQKAEEAAQQKAAEEAKMAAEEAAKQKVAEEAKRAEEAAKLKAEEEAKTRTEEAMKLKAEEKAVTRTKETAKQEAEEEAKRKSDEPKQKAEEQAKVADDESRKMAEQEAKRKAESEVKQKAEVTSSQAVAATGTMSTDEAAQSTAGSAEEAGTDDLS